MRVLAGHASSYDPGVRARPAREVPPELTSGAKSRRLHGIARILLTRVIDGRLVAASTDGGRLRGLLVDIRGEGSRDKRRARRGPAGQCWRHGCTGTGGRPIDRLRIGGDGGTPTAPTAVRTLANLRWYWRGGHDAGRRVSPLRGQKTCRGMRTWAPLPDMLSAPTGDGPRRSCLSVAGAYGRAGPPRPTNQETFERRCAGDRRSVRIRREHSADRPGQRTCTAPHRRLDLYRRKYSLAGRNHLPPTSDCRRHLP